MRFPFQCGLTLIVCFAAGYALRRTAITSQAPLAVGSATDATAPGAPPSRRVASASQTAPDLFSALKKDTDYVAQGDHLSRAIEAMDAAALAALFRSPECERLMARLMDLPQEIRFTLLPSALRRWLALDEAGVRAWLPHAPVELFSFYTISTMNSGGCPVPDPLLERMPEAVVEFIGNLPAESAWRREGLVNYVVNEVCAANPARARELIERFDTPEAREAAKNGYLAGLARGDFRAAAETWKTTMDANERNELLNGIKEAASRQPASVVEDLCWNMNEEWMEVLGAFARANPSAAAEMIERLAYHPALGRGYTGVFGEVARDLTRRVGEQAIEWALALPEETPDLVFSGIGGELAARDPASAMRLIEAGVPEGARRNAAFDGAFQTWLENDAVAALAWAETLPANATRDSLIVSGFNALTGSIRNPEAAAQLEARLDLLTDAAFTGDAGKRLQTLAQRAPKKVAAWGARNAATRPTEAPIRAAVRTWTADNPQSAGEWIATLPPGSARDAAAEGSATAWMVVNAENAAAWVEQIADPQRRLTLVPKVVESWSRHDPAAAQAWAQRMGVAISPGR